MAANAVINFVNQIGPLIVTEGYKRGYHIFSTVIAQSIVESRYGQSQLASRYHNYFGLKCGTAWVLSGKPSIVLKTKEEYKPGTLTTIKDAFRVYSDMAAGVAGYYDFISAKRYANLKTAITYKQYAEMLKADGYATSSTYVNTLCNTVTQYGLTAFDVGLNPIYFPSSQWQIGQTYTTQQDLNVREDPNGSKIAYEDLTDDAKKHAFIGTSGEGILKRGTRVTVQDIQTVGSCVWLKIPSGWICGKNAKYTYVS